MAAGTYPEQVRLEPRVQVFGGFRGDETDRAERDPGAHASVVDGGQAGPVFTLEYVDRFGGLDGLVVRNGRAVEGGGILCRVFAGTLRQLTVQDNVAARGGGLAVVDSSMPTVDRCRFLNNRALHDPVEFPGEFGGHGGALFLDLSLAEVLNSLFVSNTATATVITNRPGLGGSPVGVGGGIYVGLPTCELTWGQSRTDFRVPLLANNTLVRNQARATDGQQIRDNGGAIRFRDCLLVNNLVAFNSSGVSFQRPSLPADVRHNCVFGNGETNWGGSSDRTGQQGNIAVDPLLLPGDDYRPGPDSPCRDAGDLSVVRTTWRDLFGEWRVRGLGVDIGASELPGNPERLNYFDEWQAVQFPGARDPAVIAPEADPDGDGLPNFVEFAFGLDPKQPNPGFAALRARRANDGSGNWAVVEYSRPPGRVWSSYNLELSSDLTIWQTVPANVVPQVRSGPDDTVITRYFSSQLGTPFRAGFFRLKVQWVD